MKRALFAGLLGSVVAVALVAGAASAGDNGQAAIALHVRPVVPSGACTVPGLRSATINQQTPLLSVPSVGPFYYVYLLVCNGSDSTKIGGFECGIDYQGQYSPTGNPAGPITVFAWTKCSAANEFQSTGWPAPGGGNALAWAIPSCPSTRSEASVKYSVIAIGGYFYLGAYAPSQMFVTPRPVSGSAAVASCAADVDFIDGKVPSHLGIAGFGTVGYNPCGGVTPVRASTWSEIKSQYGH